MGWWESGTMSATSFQSLSLGGVKLYGWHCAGPGIRQKAEAQGNTIYSETGQLNACEKYMVAALCLVNFHLKTSPRATHSYLGAESRIWLRLYQHIKLCQVMWHSLNQLYF